jgi:hypothetical protein
MRTHMIVGLGLCLGLGWLAFSASPTLADLAPTSGTFSGYYHRDQLGVGHFGNFYVAPDLHEKLAKHEDKLIRLEVTKAEQPMNPGPAIILAIGKITELPQPPLKLSVQTRPSSIIAAQPFEMLITVTDERRAGDEQNPAALVPEGLLLRFRQPTKQAGPDADKPSWLIPGYTTRQLAVDTNGGQIDASIWPFQGGRPNLTTSTGPLELSPGESWTWVAYFPPDVARVDGEIHVTAQYLIAGEIPGEHGRTVTPIETWQKVTVRPRPATQASSRPAETLLRVDEVKLSPTGVDGWSNLQFRLRPAVGKKVRVPAAVSVLDGSVFPDTYACIARLEGFEADGKPIVLQVQRTPERNLPNTARTKMVDLPAAGVVVNVRFRKDSRFAPTIARLVVNFMTEQGVDTLAISDDYRDPDTPPETPFGPVTDGVKIRIRPANAEFRTGVPLTFYVQAVNASGKPVCWWKPGRGYGTNVVVELNGKALDLPKEKAEYIGGWAAQWTVKETQDWTVTLPESTQINDGRHTLRYIIVSDGGTYMNANQQPIPLVKGRILSNTAAFTIMPAQPANASPTAATKPSSFPSALNLEDAAKRLTEATGLTWRLSTRERAPGLGRELSAASGTWHGVAVPYFILPFGVNEAGKAKLELFRRNCSAALDIVAADERCVVLAGPSHEPDVTARVLKVLDLSESKQAEQSRIAHARAEWLDFRLAVARPSGTKGDLPIPLTDGPTSLQIRNYRELFDARGPNGGRHRGDPFLWFWRLPFCELSPLMVTTEDQHKAEYVLLSNRREDTLLSGSARPRPWHLKRVYATTDPQGHPAVGIEFDETAAKLMGALTEANIGRPLAVLFHGNVLSVLTIEARITDKLLLSDGKFDKSLVDRIVRSLSECMLAETATPPR